MPLQRRVPKYGFKNINRKEFKGINLDTLQLLADTKKLSSLDIASFIENGLSSKHDRVKILGRGELKAKLEVKANGFSATAKAAIEAAGGSVVVL